MEGGRGITPMEPLHLWRVYNVESGHAFQTPATWNQAQQFRIDGYEIEDLGLTDRTIQDDIIDTLRDHDRFNDP